MAQAARVVAVLLAALGLIPFLAVDGAGAAGRPSALASFADPVQLPSGPAAVSGTIRAPGGPFLIDPQGRVVFLHGVNAVYKRAPFELYPAGSRPWSFTERDASLLSRLGFNVVRLGMTWKGLEPGTAPANDPAICSPGPPRDPGQYDQAVVDRYLARIAQTVNLLGRFHIYTLLDMHQDVYNELFDGEGAPDWAVCTDGLSHTEPPGRWSTNYASPAAAAAYGHFWHNDVVGNLQGEYDRVWTAVAAYFRTNSWVVGYDPFNEPFSRSLVAGPDEQFDAQLECFYTGRANVGAPSRGAPAITCPAGDPATGVIPDILGADPRHLIFYEPDIFGRRGRPNFVGPMNFPNLVFNVHIYCSFRSGTTGNPTNLAACAAQDAGSLSRRREDRTDLGSPAQPAGPAWFVSEFGATSSAPFLRAVTAAADRSQVGWAYWSWKYYGDVTGSGDEALVRANGSLRPTALVLSRTYPVAVAGTPTSFAFNPSSGAFSLTYDAKRSVHAPTVIFVPVEAHYPHGYCARVSGATVISPENAVQLEVRNTPRARRVRVTVSAGACP